MVPVRIPAFQNGAKILSRNFHVLQYINVRHVSVSFDWSYVFRDPSAFIWNHSANFFIRTNIEMEILMKTLDTWWKIMVLHPPLQRAFST